MRMSYQRPVSMRPGTSLADRRRPISMACRVLPQPPRFHHDLSFSSCDAEQDQEAFGAAELAGLEACRCSRSTSCRRRRRGRFRPRLVCRKHAVLGLPLAAPSSFQPLVPSAKSQAKSVLSPRVTLMSLNSACVAQVPTPIAPPLGASVDQRARRRSSGSTTSPRFCAEHLLHVVGRDAVDAASCRSRSGPGSSRLWFTLTNSGA